MSQLLKSDIVKQIGDAVQAVHDEAACSSQCDTHVLGKSNQRVRNLCRFLNALFSDGLINAEKSYWPLLKDTISKRECSDVVKIWKPQTDRGKSLAWLYNSVNENTLEYYMCSLPNNLSIVSKYYRKNACLFDAQILYQVSMLLRGLEGVSIYIEPKNASDLNKTSKPDTDSMCKVVQSRKTSPSDIQSIKSADPDQPDLKENVTVISKPLPGQKLSLTQRKLSRSSSLALLEHPVADFSDCPNELGLSDIDCLLLVEGAEASFDALEYQFPEEPFRPWAKSSIINRVTLKRRPTLNNTSSQNRSIAKIDNTGDLANLPPNSLETSNTFMCVPPPLDFDHREMSSSTPITQNDAEIMLNEILKTSTRAAHLASVLETKNGTETPKSMQPFGFTPSKLDFSSEQEESGRFLTAIDDFSNTTNGKIDNQQILSEKIDKNELLPDETIDKSPTLQPENKKNDENAGPGMSEFEKRLYSRLEQIYEPKPIDNSNMVLEGGSVLTSSTDLSETANFGPNSLTNSINNFEREMFNITIESSSVIDRCDTNGNLNNMANGEEERRKNAALNGELSLDSCEILELTTNVMHDGEQFYKMFRVYLHHRMGNSLTRFLLLTNKCFYLLIAKPNSASTTASDSNLISQAINGLMLPNGCNNSGQKFGLYYYVVDFRIPYERIDYISVGLNGQYFNLHLKQKRQCLVICTACDSFTRSILSNLEFSIRRLQNVNLPNVYTEAKPQTVYLKKWLFGETGTDENKVCLYSLIYWDPNLSKCKFGALTSSNTVNRNGYLYAREYYPNGWLKKSTEWHQSYFILQGRKLYQFEDMSCKVGTRIFNLQDEVIGCRQTETSDHTYCIELYFKDPSTVVQLSCPTKHELQQWLCSFYNSFSMADTVTNTCSCLACCVVLTDNYLMLGQETTSIGFIRTLAISRLEALTDFKICKVYNGLVMTVAPATSNENEEYWHFCFVSQSELDNFVNTLKPLIKEFSCTEMEDDSREMPFVEECSKHWLDIKSA